MNSHKGSRAPSVQNPQLMSTMGIWLEKLEEDYRSDEDSSSDTEADLLDKSSYKMQSVQHAMIKKRKN